MPGKKENPEDSATPTWDFSRALMDLSTPTTQEAHPGPDMIDLPAAPAGDAPSAPIHLPAIGELLDGRYEIIGEIGRGGMGAVFKAVDRHGNDRPVAIKFILRDKVNARDLVRFSREAATIAKLGNIEGVAQLLESRLADAARPYIVNEFVDGWNLTRFVRDRCPTRRDRVWLVADLCDTLHAVHDVDVLHRDIKPGNILVRRNRSLRDRWAPVLVDFGIAVDRGPDDGAGGERGCGTLPFMSREQYTGLENLDRRTDIFSLGVVLYWLLSEHLPYPRGLDSTEEPR